MIPVAVMLLTRESLAEAPIREVSESLPVPVGVDPVDALASVDDIPEIFALYEPVIPKLPGIQIDLEKQVVSRGTPCILELPVSGKVIGKDIVEKARVTATAQQTSCGGTGKLDGRKITLSFDDSTYNIERRIDRIEIIACLGADPDGTPRISATGRMYAGYKPEDPELNAFTEAIGAKALQGAFFRQVPAVLEAVQQHWTTLP